MLQLDVHDSDSAVPREASDAKIQTPSGEGRVMKAAKNRSMPEQSVFIELQWAVEMTGEELCVCSVIRQSYSRPFGCQHIPL